ncbi:MAG: hypothetical protein DHS20C15_31440 [Planctomycetota bacterium]|nr:MAG: hypothetical protein DHS20C15_31440 [Planctomycetota bacterium]
MLLTATFLGSLLISAALQDAAPAAEEPAATPAEELVILRPEWYVGDRYQLEFVFSRERVENGAVTLSKEKRSLIDVEVVDEDDTSFTIVWTFPAPVLPDELPREVAEQLDRFPELGVGLQLRVRTDEYGSFASIENAAELGALTSSLTEMMLEKAAEEERDMSPEKRANLRALMESVLNSGVLLQSMASNLAPYYMASGLALEVAKPLAYDEVLPNLFGGPDFPAKAAWLVESHDAELQQAVVRYTQAIDPEHGSAAILETMRMLGSQAGAAALPSENDISSFEINDEAVFLYDIAYGLPIKAEVSRHIAVGETTQVDTRSYRLIEYPEDPVAEVLDSENSDSGSGDDR